MAQAARLLDSTDSPSGVLDIIRDRDPLILQLYDPIGKFNNFRTGVTPMVIPAVETASPDSDPYKSSDRNPEQSGRPSIGHLER